MKIPNRLLRHASNMARSYIIDKPKDTYKNYDEFVTTIWLAAIIAALKVDGLELWIKDPKTGELHKLEE